VWSSAEPISLVLAAGALIALVRFKTGMIRTILVCVALGFLAQQFLS
jgi:chromate transporter